MILTVAIIALLFAGALFAVGFAVVDRGDDMSRRLAELDPFPVENARNDKIVESLVDARQQVLLSGRFAEAGWYKTTVISFTLTRLGAAVALAAAGALIAGLMHASLFIMAVAALVAAIVGFIAPSFVLDSAVRKRKAQIARRVPDLLDMVSTTVEAGTALNGALAVAVTRMQGPLSEEFRMTLSDIRIGMPRADALTALARRVQQVDLTSVVTALVQTERLGGNVAHVLDELAEEARNRRMSRAEEAAAKLPVKMVIPMALFMLPALFVMIFGPVAAEMLNK
ncbi:MAG TPA: type II secretion system F family protein [Candidatus Elarobacter sp.]|nr:type II secretion system F family protein [Candidatus Elarobacter sp.]